MVAQGLAVAGEEPEMEGNLSRVVISVVAPVFNEAELLGAFCAEMRRVLEELGEPWEIILVNDGSRDRSLEIMREQHRLDPRIKSVSFSKNFGGQAAITAGLDHAAGDAVVVIDADLQDPPDVVKDLVARWREGYQVVYAQRASRAGETFFKRLTASIYYRLIRGIANVDIPLDTGEFRLLDRKAADALRSIREQHRYLRGLSAWIGFKTIAVPYERAARTAGETKYTLSKMMRLAVDGITNFSYLPLQMATYFGFVVAGLSLVGILAAVLVRVFLGHELTGQATTLVSVLFLGGVQLIFLGVLGEYLGRIYDEVKRRPLYIVDEALGFPENDDRRPRIGAH
jgi:polyisoprenyl-phosphate glycosyltransferase